MIMHTEKSNKLKVWITFASILFVLAFRRHLNSNFLCVYDQDQYDVSMYQQSYKIILILCIPFQGETHCFYRFFLTYLKNCIYNFSVDTIFFKDTDENEFLFTHGAYNLLNSECTPVLIGFNAILKWEYIN